MAIKGQIVTDLAIQMKQLDIPQQTAIGVVHLLDTEEQAQQMLEFLKTNHPTEQEIFQKLDELLAE